MASEQSNRIFTRQTGSKQEQLASRYLQSQGLALLRANYYCKMGEIDLIMTESGQFLVFVEVRYRRQQNYGDAIASVNFRKQRKIRLTAAHFLAAYPHLAHFACRFDVVGVSPAGRSGTMHFEWIRNAFM